MLINPDRVRGRGRTFSKVMRRPREAVLGVDLDVRELDELHPCRKGVRGLGGWPFAVLIAERYMGCC
jgi:hypothetical protein